MGYLTPDTAPSTVTCRALFVPDSEECLAIVRGALQELTFPFNWTKQGTLTPDEAAALYVDMFDRFCFNEGTCRMIGEIIAYAGTTSPNENWLVCDGATLLIDDYPDLYAVIGDNYGTGGVGSFMLPDLIRRSLEGFDPIVIPTDIGTYRGVEDVTLTEAQIPSHAHTIDATLGGLAVAPGELPVLVPNPIPTITGFTGGGGSHDNIPPRLAIMYLIVAKDG